MMDLAKTYNPEDFEERLYDYWNENEYFKAKVDKEKKPYTIMMPPPNVTGSLHMGHALYTLQDILIRWKRMEGYSALWLPGTDHASISTEVRVVEKIRKEGHTKESLGREGFLDEAWAWTYKYGNTIKNQLKKLGLSCDWTRDRFTLDEGLSNAVEEVFVRLYDKGFIYRGDRIINYCPSCQTAISDAEVEHENHEGSIWHIKYPIKDSDKGIVIATTRPETMLGDLAVAVHPEDSRYKDLIGKTLILPLVNREIPIIADEYVEMEFGSGALKITPSHDPNDFEIGARANLGQCIVINGDGTITDGYGNYSGLDRFEARKLIVEDLEKGNYLVKIEKHDNAVGHCERCSTIIEPLISKQWFVKMEEMAKPALDAYKNGELKIIPERFGKIYTDWLENIKDWCISRQLWWGHRLPVYYCNDCDKTMVSRSKPQVCNRCKSKNIIQDEDTLDTWFSSALWPFSTLGWPEKTEDYDYFYPTDVLITGYDIIFFWVVRMVFSGIEHTGKVPFKDVLLTGLIRDSQGKKMSKSAGNGIDPLDIIEQYGADALRFTLVTGNSPGNDLRFHIERVEASRNFANKLWNASRFVLMNLDKDLDLDRDNNLLEEEDKWILSRINTVAKEVKKNLSKYEIGLAAQRIYDFPWDEYCDWYIEIVKARLYGEDKESKRIAQGTLIIVLEKILKLLHPFMPFITEEIWQHLPNRKEALIISNWPQYDSSMSFPLAENNMRYITSAIRGIRNARQEMDINPSNKSELIFVTKDKDIKEILNKGKRYFYNLGGANEISIKEEYSNADDEDISVVLDKFQIYIPLKGLIDYKKEIERLEREIDKLESEINRAEKKLSNADFIAKAPEKIVNIEKEKLEKYKGMYSEVIQRLNNLKSN